MAKAEDLDQRVKGNGILRTVSPTATVAEAANLMAQYRVGCLLVIGKDEQAVGIVTEADITRKASAQSLDLSCVTVSDIMTREVIGCTPATPLATLNWIMAEYNIRHLPILEKGEPVGMVSSRDIHAYEREVAEAQAQWHRPSTAAPAGQTRQAAQNGPENRDQTRREP